MERTTTCGQGLAESSILPATLADVIAALADNLDVHMRALDVNDPPANAEHAAYAKLAREHRAIAAALQTTAREMAGHRSLPMGRHDQYAMSDPKVREAFSRFVKAKQELRELLDKSVERDRELLAAMGG